MYIKILAFLSTCLLTFNNKAANHETEKLYTQSLIYHLSSINLDTVYVFKDFEINLPKKVKKIAIVEIENFSEFVKEKESFYAIKILPIEVNKGCVDVKLVDYFVEFKEGDINLSNIGGESFTFCYNNKLKKHQLTKRGKHIL
jgi:hypothetical protein